MIKDKIIIYCCLPSPLCKAEAIIFALNSMTFVSIPKKICLIFNNNIIENEIKYLVLLSKTSIPYLTIRTHVAKLPI